MAEDIFFVGQLDDMTDKHQLEELNQWIRKVQARINQFDPGSISTSWLEGAAAGQVIQSIGVGSPPVWESNVLLTGLRLTGLSASALVATNASKQLVSDTRNFVIGVGTSKITVSDTEPPEPRAVGDIWIDTSGA